MPIKSINNLETAEAKIQEALHQAILDLLKNITEVNPKYLKNYVIAIDILLSKCIQEETIIELKGYGDKTDAEEFFKKLKENKIIHQVEPTIEVEDKDELSETLKDLKEALGDALAGIIVEVKKDEKE